MENKQQKIKELKERLETEQNRKQRIWLKLAIHKLETENSDK